MFWNGYEKDKAKTHFIVFLFIQLKSIDLKCF